MKQIGLLSRHAVSNYGSILQAIALERELRTLGCRAEYVDYRLKRDMPLWEAYREVGLAAPVKALPKSIGMCKFEKMRGETLHQSERVWDYAGVQELCGRYDALCIGSDQVWNILSDGIIDDVYLLNQICDDKYKFSYASSFGKMGVADSEIDRVITSLRRFNRISVREESGKEFLEAHGIKATVCVDPVHLLTNVEWSQIIKQNRPKHVEADYILVYNLHPDADFDSYVSQVTHNLTYQIVSIRPTLRKTCGHNLFFPTLGEFLWLFKNAKIVLTDSFHGTAFSILFNTQFVDILPKMYSERNTAILSRYGLAGQTSITLSPSRVLNSKINWDYVNDRLTDNRIDSIQYLKECLSEF